MYNYISSAPRSYRAGANLCNPFHPTVDIAYVRDALFEESYTWEDHYNKWLFSHVGYDIPKPCMYMNKPYWRGGLGIVFHPNNNSADLERIYTLRCKPLTVSQLRIYQPTDAEYEKHFKKHVERGTFYIVPQDNSIRKRLK